MKSADLSADRRPTIGRSSVDCQNPKTVGRWKKKYNKVVIILCCDYIKKYSRSIEFLFFYRPINIILSADWSDYIKDITRRFPKSVPKLYNRPIVGRRSADTSAETSADDKWRATIGRSSADGRPTHRPMICGSFKHEIGRLIGRSSADWQNPKTVGRWKKNYNKVVIIYFLSADEKRAKIWHFIGR